MAAFTFQTMVDDLHACVGVSDSRAAIRSYLEELIQNPSTLLAASDQLNATETLFFEDDNLSIWHCRFQPGTIMPPHEHLLPVFIACYAGEEKSVLFQSTDAGLDHIGDLSAHAGDVILLDQDAIHAVTANSDRPSEAIHVYLGPLMTLKRDLFDWESGDAVPFTMDAFESMKRPA
jgi:predicted metal-dependent enzyme (double-stranded beta helix superfamily)